MQCCVCLGGVDLADLRVLHPCGHAGTCDACLCGGGDVRRALKACPLCRAHLRREDLMRRTTQ